MGVDKNIGSLQKGTLSSKEVMKKGRSLKIIGGGESDEK
jgi:hypothetical protein